MFDTLLANSEENIWFKHTVGRYIEYLENKKNKFARKKIV